MQTEEDPEQMDVVKKTLKIIKEKKIKPYSKWYFLLIDYILWFLLFFSGFLVALSAGVFLHIVFWDNMKVKSEIMEKIRQEKAQRPSVGAQAGGN